MGGSCTRPTVIEQALRALGDGQPRLIVLDPGSRGAGAPGRRRLPHDLSQRRKRGDPHPAGAAGAAARSSTASPPTARALARLGEAMGYACGPSIRGPTRRRFPGRTPSSPTPGPRGPQARESVFAVVATQGEWDEEAVLAALAHAPAYLGVVASAKRFEEMRAFLARKLSAAQRPLLQRAQEPGRPRIGARSGEEIAAQHPGGDREGAAGLPPLRSVRAAVASRPSRPCDPVCGMTVTRGRRAPPGRSTRAATSSSAARAAARSSWRRRSATLTAAERRA